MPVMTWEEIRKLRENSATQNKSNVMTWEQIRAARGIQAPQAPQPTQSALIQTPTPTPEVIVPKKYGLFGENSLFNDIKTGVKKLQAKGEQKTKEIYGPKTPELQLSKALREEKSAELTAKVFTAPVRWTAGSLATIATSYALEKANSNKKYTPKTDAEKLIIGETDIQRLTQQEDLYGIVARATSIPVALTLAAIVENPFIKGTGIGTTIKKSLESAIEKKVIKTIGTKELIKLADEAIQAEVKIGKIKPEEALKASLDINNFRVKELPPVKKLLPSKENPLIQEARKYKSADEFVKAQPKLYHSGTADIKAVDTGKSNFQKTFYMSDNADYAKSFGGKNSTINEIAVDAKANLADMRKPSPELVSKIEGLLKRENAVFSDKQIVDGIKAGKAHFAELPEVKKALKELGFDGQITSEVPYAKNIGVWNKDVVKTKSQLTDIYNQATKHTVKPITPDIPKDSFKDSGSSIPNDTFIPKVPQRISDQAIAEGLVKDAQEFGELPVQQVQHLKDQALIMGKIIDEDPELLKEIARGKATYPGLNPSHAFITVKNQALKNNDLELLRELATSPSAVPQQATEAGRLIQALDEGSDDAFNNIKKVVDTRTNATKDAVRREVSNIKKKNIIKKSSPKKDEWLSFLDEIKCPK